MLRRMERFAAAMPGPFLQNLTRANQLMAAGQYQPAGQLYAQLAEDAQSSGHPRKAANLHAQAAHAAALQHSSLALLAQGRTALHAFQQLGMQPRFAGFLASLTTLLRAQGMSAEADTLQHEFGGAQPAPAQPAVQAPAPQRLRLPPACSQCGAPVRRDEVEWIDEQSAECGYCGAVIQAD